MGIWPKKYREILAINFDKYPIQIFICLIFTLIVFLLLIVIFARTCYCYFELVWSKIFRPEQYQASAGYSYLNNWYSTWFGEMGALFEAIIYAEGILNGWYSLLGIGLSQWLRNCADEWEDVPRDDCFARLVFFWDFPSLVFVLNLEQLPIFPEPM